MKSLFCSLMVILFFIGNITFCQSTDSNSTVDIGHFLSNDFYKSNSTIVKNNKFIKVINWIAINADGSKLTLRDNSVRFNTFKGHIYLKFAFDSDNIFNSFHYRKDEIAYSIINELANNLIDPDYGDLSAFSNIYGYEFMIFTGTRNFIDDNDPSKPLVIHFFIPKNQLKQYRQLDITLKQLLHQSIVVANNEKLDL